MRNFNNKNGVKIMINPTIRKILILNSILLIVILALLIILNWDLLIDRFTHKPAELYETDNEDNSEVKYYAKQDSLKADFEKLKNDTITLPDEIIKIIEPELKGFNWNEEFSEEDLHGIFHETIFAQQFPFDHSQLKNFIVVTFCNYDGNYFHAAAGRISLFEFEKDHQSWHLTRSFLAFGNGNEYGYEPLGCELVRIGYNNKYALIVHTSYSGNGGHEKKSQLVYSVIDEELELVFDFTAYEYYFDYPQDIEYTDGYSDMRILKCNKTWFDIETKSEGTEWGDKTPGAIKHLVFNGDEYVEAKRNFKVNTN
jgi:hypothetical protein